MQTVGELRDALFSLPVGSRSRFSITGRECGSAFGILTRHCQKRFGTGLSVECVNKFAGEVAVHFDLMPWQVNAMTLSEFANNFSELESAHSTSRKPASDNTERPASGTCENEALAKYQDPLTPLGKRILKSLWSRKRAVQFETLRAEAWEGARVSVSGIERRLKDIEKRWTEAGLLDIDLEISTASTSVKLLKPSLQNE